MASPGPVRAMVVWLPDWPISAARVTQGLPPAASVALIDKGIVVACSAEARTEGVRRGLRLREAQLRCPDLTIGSYDPIADARAFEPVVLAIERIIPGVDLLRPGLCAVRMRGAARYYGGELAAAERLLESLAASSLGAGARAGIADGRFAAEQAAYRGGAERQVVIIEEGESARFLAPLPIETLTEPSLTPLLTRLGARTLGDFAALAASDVRTRFGELGRRAHERASGLDPRAVTARVVPHSLECSADFEPPLDRVDQVAFGFRTAAERFVHGVTAAGLVCTAVRVTVTSESGAISSREWAHPRYFSAPEVLDRVRWQLQGAGGVETGLGAAVARVLVEPVSVDAISHHEKGLWGQGPDERIHHGLSRIQSMLGHEAVLTAVAGGGRLLAERRVLVPWGDAPPPSAQSLAGHPWPGSLPEPAPASVFSPLRAALVFDERGEPLDVELRGALEAAPAWFCPGAEDSGRRRVVAWAGPWPLQQRWWDAERARQAHRFQLIDDRGEAWLLLLEEHRWWLEARYD